MGTNPPPRGPEDQNYAYSDGSVQRLLDMLVNNPNDSPTLDDRIVRVPTNSGGLGVTEYRNLPGAP